MQRFFGYFLPAKFKPGVRRLGDPHGFSTTPLVFFPQNPQGFGKIALLHIDIDFTLRCHNGVKLIGRYKQL